MSHKLWQDLTDTDSQRIKGGVGLLLPACQAAREAALRFYVRRSHLR